MGDKRGQRGKKQKWRSCAEGSDKGRAREVKVKWVGEVRNGDVQSRRQQEMKGKRKRGGGDRVWMKDKMEAKERKRMRWEEREEGESWALGRWASLRCRTGPSGRKQSQVSDGKHWASIWDGKRPGKEIQTPAPHFLSTIYPARLRQPPCFTSRLLSGKTWPSSAVTVSPLNRYNIWTLRTSRVM